MKPEIQALRALAVGLVVAYHLWPSAVPGGFIGVDVFFAISGYLITSLLLREIERTGRLSLSAFWARRARRILPAALATLLACAVATMVLVPVYYQRDFLGDIGASAEYIQNWHLAATATDYFDAERAASPVQHFWSLSAEEQFYAIWPLVLAATLSVASARSARTTRAALALTMGAFTCGSFAWSLWETTGNPASAYFVTPTRAWEFGVGGLLALVPPATRHAAFRAALSWAGIAAILIAALVYTDATRFPGWAAIAPTIGGLAVIRAGAPGVRGTPLPVLRLPPVQFVGDISYSVYLWHWPLITIAPFVVGPLHPNSRIGVLMLTLLIAWLSKLLIEDPLRAATFLTRRHPGITLAGAAAATGIVMAAVAGGSSRVERQIGLAQRASDRVLAARPRCFGAASRDPRHPCHNPRLRLMVVPTPIDAADRPNAPCTFVERGDTPVCAFGVDAEEASRTVALVGDSHASHWRASLAVVAADRGWRGLSITHTACPFSRATKDLEQPARSSCTAWNKQVIRWFRRHPEVTTVFVSAISGGKGVIARPGQDPFAVAVAGYAAAWRALPSSVERVIVIRDTPKAQTDTGPCVQDAIAARRAAGAACALRRRDVLDADPEEVAARRTGAKRVRVVDMTRFICGSRRCFPVVGGALVYKDQHHITTVFGETLGPFLGRAFDAASR